VSVLATLTEFIILTVK